MTNTLTGTHAFDWITQFSNAFHGAQQTLTDLDRLAGDGDFGTNIASALRRTADGLPDREIASFATVFGATSRGS
ncbi:hypothetical protein [Pseudarthrobacter sp. Y6]|uniref:hypothetical protein n=1 Tax=Pseudarthrobacter sp. Y6 TaxID=3418422 RepID=UPI003CF9E33C